MGRVRTGGKSGSEVIGGGNLYSGQSGVGGRKGRLIVGGRGGKLSVTLGIGKLGSGGSCVCVEPPPVGIGRLGNVGCGSVGRGGKGGSVVPGLGKDGTVVWRRLRAATETWMLEEHRIMNKMAAKKQCL
ncbi:unnamed protein product [Malus baccata var. baccata]